MGTPCVCLRRTLTVFPLQWSQGNHPFVSFLHYISQARCGIWGIRNCLCCCPWGGVVDHVYVFLWAFLSDFSCCFSGGGSIHSLFVYSKSLHYLHVRLWVPLQRHDLMGLNMLRLLIVMGVVSLSSFTGFVHSFYNQFSNRHCHSLRQLLPWITAFRCHFVMPLIMTVQVPAILYVLRLPRDSVIGSFRQRYPSISLWRWRLICSCFKETLSQKTLEFEGDLSVLVVLRVELSLYCLGSSYQIQMKM